MERKVVRDCARSTSPNVVIKFLGNAGIEIHVRGMHSSLSSLAQPAEVIAVKDNSLRLRHQETSGKITVNTYDVVPFRIGDILYQSTNSEVRYWMDDRRFKVSRK
jgi:hypothetical protein